MLCIDVSGGKNSRTARNTWSRGNNIQDKQGVHGILSGCLVRELLYRRACRYADQTSNPQPGPQPSAKISKLANSLGSDESDTCER